MGGRRLEPRSGQKLHVTAKWAGTVIGQLQGRGSHLSPCLLSRVLPALRPDGSKGFGQTPLFWNSPKQGPGSFSSFPLPMSAPHAHLQTKRLSIVQPSCELTFLFIYSQEFIEHLLGSPSTAHSKKPSRLLAQLECSVPTLCLQLQEKEKGRGEVGFNPSLEPTILLIATVLVCYSKHLF